MKSFIILIKKFSSLDLRYKYSFTILLGAIAFISSGFFTFWQPTPLRSGDFLNRYADDIYKKCLSEKYHPDCYNREIPKILDRVSIAEAFRITKLIQKKDSEFNYCHLLAHNISAGEVTREPNKWKDIVLSCPTGMCSDGCIHGALLTRFKKESFSPAEVVALEPELFTLCKDRPTWHPTGQQKWSCYHALGHLTMYLTRGDVNQSLNLCERVILDNNSQDFLAPCFDGVFMQVFQPLEPEDSALIKGKQPTKEELSSFCRDFSSERKVACLIGGWPLFYNELVHPEGLTEFCGLQSDPRGEKRCFKSIVAILTTQFNLETRRIFDYCLNLPEDLVNHCFAVVSSRMVETDSQNIDSAVNFCKQAASFDKEGRCWERLAQFSAFGFHPGSEGFHKLCRSLIEPWRSRCLKGEMEPFINRL